MASKGQTWNLSPVKLAPEPRSQSLYYTRQPLHFWFGVPLNSGWRLSQFKVQSFPQCYASILWVPSSLLLFPGQYPDTKRTLHSLLAVKEWIFILWICWPQLYYLTPLGLWVLASDPCFPFGIIRLPISLGLVLTSDDIVLVMGSDRDVYHNLCPSNRTPGLPLSIRTQPSSTSTRACVRLWISNLPVLAIESWDVSRLLHLPKAIILPFLLYCGCFMSV